MVNTVVEVQNQDSHNLDTVKEIRAQHHQEIISEPPPKQPLAEFDQFIKEQKAYC